MASRPKKTSPLRDALAELGDLKIRPPVQPAPVEALRTPEAEARRFKDIVDVAVSLSSSLDLKAILDAIVDGIMRVTRCERGFVMLREADGTFSMFTGRTSQGAPWDERSACQISITVRDKVVNTHQPVIGGIDTMDDLRTQDSILEQHIRSVVCLPLLFQQQMIGVIYADSSFVIPSFEEADRFVLEGFGAQAAVAIANARHYGEVRERGDRLQEQNRTLRQQLGQHVVMAGMVIRNKQMRDVFARAEKIAPSDMSSVLIRGESGTGKELLARAIHEMSPRRDRPCVAVDCTTLPAALVESILFGHCKGAFTGADTDRPGYFEVADGGTVFLDEIGEMPLEVQPKLLRVLQEHEISRVGEMGRVRKVDVNIVAATNRDLPKMVEEGLFRGDLYYRLKVAQLYVPPLRERREDILPLAEYFLQRLAEKRGQPVPRLSSAAGALLLGNPWVGNVRELENAMEWGLALQDDRGVIQADAFEQFFQPVGGRSASPAEEPGSLREKLDRFEARVIGEALARNDYNVSATARELGVSRQQLHLKIKKYRLTARPE